MSETAPRRRRAEPHSREMLAYKSLSGTASSDSLDLMRGTAALLVMLGHLRNLFLLSPVEVERDAGLAVKFVYFITGFGHSAVMIFFALSGFLVGGSVIRGRMEGKWNWGLYATNRLSRLWIVLIPALLLGAIWDHCGILAFGTSGIYGGRADVGIAAAAPRLSASVMAGNALFLQGILTPTFGSNGPLWSLSYEFWYYVLFPLMVLAFPTNTKKMDWSMVLYPIAAVALMFFIGAEISLYFLIWLLGAAINFAPDRSERASKLWYVVATLALLSVVAALRLNTGIEEFRTDLAVGVASTIFIFAVLRNNARSKSGLYSRAVRGLAGFSYTLYLVHLPALIFISAWLVPGRRWQPDAVHVAMLAAIGICALAYAFAIAQLTEYRTGAVRSRVIAAFDLEETNASKPR